MLLTDVVSILALLGFCICWFRIGAGNRDALLWISAGAALLFAVMGYSDYRGVALLSIAVSVLLLVALVIRRLRGPRVLSGTPWLSGVLFSLLTAFAAFGYWTFPIFEMPAPSGEHAVGVRDFELTDTSRKGVLAAGPDETRRLLVRVWYPAESVEGLEPRPYLNDAEAATTGRRQGENLMMMPWIFTHLRHVSTHSFETDRKYKGDIQCVVAILGQQQSV